MADDRKLFFLAGLPRAGSTVLANLLMQNPRIHVSGTSQLLDCIASTRLRHDQMNEFRAMPAEMRDRKRNQITKGILRSWYEDVERPVVIDKSRGWPNYIELVEEALGRSVKIICCVRDVRAILASFEKLYRKGKSGVPNPDERTHPLRFIGQAGRCATWMDDGGPVGMAVNTILDAIHRGFKNRLVIIEYEKLVSNRREDEIKYLYGELNEDRFAHDYENIEQLTQEDDYQHGIPGLHDIKPKLVRDPDAESPKDVLGAKVYAAYEQLTKFWEKD